MTFTLSIKALEATGACARECVQLRQAFPDGTIVFDMSEYSKISERGVNVIWAAPLLPVDGQKELVMAWYDRALAGQSPPWKSEMRALIYTPHAANGAAELQVRLDERRAAPSEDELAVALAGVGYAAAAFSIKFAEVPLDKSRQQSAVAVLAQWCARAAAHIESTTFDAVMTDFQRDTFAKLVQYGPVACP